MGRRRYLAARLFFRTGRSRRFIDLIGIGNCPHEKQRRGYQREMYPSAGDLKHERETRPGNEKDHGEHEIKIHLSSLVELCNVDLLDALVTDLYTWVHSRERRATLLSQQVRQRARVQWLMSCPDGKAAVAARVRNDVCPGFNNPLRSRVFSSPIVRANRSKLTAQRVFSNLYVPLHLRGVARL